MRRYLMAKFVARNRVAVDSAVAAVAALAAGMGATLWQAHEARQVAWTHTAVHHPPRSSNR